MFGGGQQPGIEAANFGNQLVDAFLPTFDKFRRSAAKPGGLRVKLREQGVSKQHQAGIDHDGLCLHNGQGNDACRKNQEKFFQHLFSVPPIRSLLYPNKAGVDAAMKKFFTVC